MSQDENLLNEMRLFLESLPSDLGRGSLNGMRVQLLHKVCANLQAAKPADALESLPVVALYDRCAEQEHGGNHGITYEEYATSHQYRTWKPLTDHAQATAEIAKRDAEIDRLNLANEQLIFQIGGVELSEQDAQRELTTLRAKLARVDGLIRQARLALESCDQGHISDGGKQWYDETLVEPAIEALATYEAAQGEKQ